MTDPIVKIEINFSAACMLADKIQSIIPLNTDTNLFLAAIAILVEAHSTEPKGIDQQVEFISKISHELFFQQHLNDAHEVGHA